MATKVAYLSTNYKTIWWLPMEDRARTIRLVLVPRILMVKARVTQAYRDDMSERLQKARAAAGFTQASFAAALGLEEKTYAKYEGGRLLPVHLVTRVCRLLHLDPWFLLDGHGRDAARPKPHLVK